MYLILVLLLACLITPSSTITCYTCESWKDFRCLDPFDFQPFHQENCDLKSYVRDKPPVFCEKVFQGPRIVLAKFNVCSPP